MVVMNKNNKDVVVDSKRFAEILQSKSAATNIITNKKYTLKDGVIAEGKTASVFEIG